MRKNYWPNNWKNGIDDGKQIFKAFRYEISFLERDVAFQNFSLLSKIFYFYFYQLVNSI